MSSFAYISCEAPFFNQLEGVYEIGSYTLIPCTNRLENQYGGFSNFILKFPYTWVTDENKGLEEFKNQPIAIEEAKIFVAWFSTITRSYIDLSHQDRGNGLRFGPISFDQPSNEITQDHLESIFHIKPDLIKGTYHAESNELVPFPSRYRWLKIHPDTLRLTEKIYSLPSKVKDKFIDACYSYQFSLQVKRRLPSVSIVALVNCVEIIMRDEIISEYCEDAKKICPSKQGAMKKFRHFFEGLISEQLPDNFKKYLNEIYKKRSNYVHRALLGEGLLRGPQYLTFGRFEQDEAVLQQRKDFDDLVHFGLISWLNNI
jgi:hypothetical protein